MPRTNQLLGALAGLALAASVGIAAAGNGGTNNDGLDTPADEIHPAIHANNNAGNNANPNGVSDGGGNMHGIANVPGQNGANDPGQGAPGFADQLETVHGGIGAYNPNAD